MKKKYLFIILLNIICNGAAFAQNTITFTETYTSGVVPTTTQKNHWNSFKTLLTTHCYSKVTLKGSANTTGFTISNPSDVSTIAGKIHGDTTFQLASGGHNWQYCANDLRIDGPAVSFCGSCNDGNCLRPLNNYMGNWGGLNATTTCGAGTQTITLEFTYNEASIAEGDSISLCDGDSVILNASSGASYLWSNTDTTQSITVDSTGTFKVKVTYGNGCIDTSDVTVVTLHPLPTTPVITQSNDTLFCTRDSSYKSYQWYNDATPIFGATDTLYVMDSCRHFGIMVTDSNGCTASVYLPVLQNYLCLTIGVKHYDRNEITVFPNPATDKLTIHTSSENSHTASVSIVNILGEKLISCYPLLGRGVGGEAIDISKLPAGIYFVEVAGENGRWVRKFIKQ